MTPVQRGRCQLAVVAVLSLAVLWALHNPGEAQASLPESGLPSGPHTESIAAPPDPLNEANFAARLDKKIYLPITFRDLLRTPLKGIVLSSPSCQDVLAVGARWISQYSTEATDCSQYGIESVPMIASAAILQDLLNGTRQLRGNSQYVAGFNEPDVTGMSPTQAAILWHDHVQPLTAGKKLVAPAVTQYEDCGDYTGQINPATGQPYNRDDCPTPRGAWWLHQFRRDYVSRYGSAPRVDVLPVHVFHWWGELNPGDVAGWLASFTLGRIALADEWGVPEIWITEFNATAGQMIYPRYPQCAGVGPDTPRTPITMGCYPSLSQAQITSETAAYINWLKQQPKMTRFAWFSSRQEGTEWWSCGHVGDPAPTPLCDRPLIVWASPLNAPVLTADGQAYKLR